MQVEVKMTERFELTINGNEVAQCEIIDHNQENFTVYNNLGNVYFSSAMKVCELLNALNDENEQLKQQLSDCKKDEKQLSISFMEFKMQLIEVLQQNYNYAYNQRQRNLDNSLIARTYEVLYQTVDDIAETMNVDIERFPKSDDLND